MAKFLGIDWVPLNTPFRRRLQTFCIAHYLWVFMFSQFLVFYLMVHLVFWTRFWWIVVLYFVYFCLDRNSSKRGSHPSKWFRKAAMWRVGAEYFPINLIKTAELDPNRNYIFGYHPHGIASIGAMYNFGTDATGFDVKFPGIKMHLCTLASNFLVPFRREYVMALGIIDASKESIGYVLTRPEPGNAVMLVVGGAQEALNAKPGSYTLVLGHRRGFVRLAIQKGADLVPVFSFGENELYLQVDNPEGSKLRKFQQGFKEKFGFSPPIFHGRGIFNYNLGLMPFRKPINAVVGKAIRVEKNEKPTDEEVEIVHQKYIDTLVALFDDHKLKYGVPAEAKLRID